MKSEISRRDMFEPVAVHMKDMGFEGVNTRRGKTIDLFHVDGKGVVGRGTVQIKPVNQTQLETVYQDVYLKKDKDRWVHFSYGGYTSEAQALANRLGIALFEFKADGEIAPISKRASNLYRRKPSERWKTQVAVVAGALVSLVMLIGVIVAYPVVGWTLAVIAVLVVVGFVIELIGPHRFIK